MNTTKQLERKGSFQKIFQNNLVLVFIIVLVILTIAVEPKFLSLSNMTNIMRQFGPLAMVSLGMTFVILGGFIDLSVAGIMSLVAVVTVSLIEPLGQGGALLVGLSLGALCGLINSIIILTCGALTSAEALFITFGMSTVYGAIALILAGGATQHMSWIEKDTSLFTQIGQGSLGFISVSFIIFLVVLFILFIFQDKTYMGRVIKLTGSNKTAARLSGVHVKGSIVSIYTISGLMTALGAVMLFSRVTTASPVIGAGYETNAILAVVVGGTSLIGGSGSVLRTVLGVLLVTLLSNCMNLLGVSTYLQLVLSGAILILAIWLDNRKEQ